MTPSRWMTLQTYRATKKTFEKSARGRHFFTCTPPRPRLNTRHRGSNAKIPGGVIAQLGERLNGIQEVRASIPRGSTK